MGMKVLLIKNKISCEELAKSEILLAMLPAKLSLK
jgi:hypothetical protein